MSERNQMLFGSKCNNDGIIIIIISEHTERIFWQR